MDKDINYYRMISGIYEVNSLRDHQKLSVKNYIGEHFDECVAYENVLINGQERELLIMHKTNIYTDKGGIKVLTRPSETIDIGDLITWNNNVWLCIELDPFEEPYCKGYIKRCNNVLRGLDNNGKLHEYPCVFDEHISQTDFVYKDGINTSYGRITVYVQINDFTSNIFENRRFIFNKQAYKVTYVFNHIMSDITQTNYSGVIKLEMIKDQISKDDDLINMIAYSTQYQYVISLNQTSFSGLVGDIGTLIPTITLNGKPVTKELIWTSDNEEVAIIDSVGTYALLSDGVVNFKCIVKDNENLFATCTVNVVKEVAEHIEVIDIVFEGISKNNNDVYTDDILQTMSKTYTVKKLINNVDSEEELTITDISVNIPNGYYTFTNNGNNTFTVKNLKRYDNGKAIIRVTDGQYESILEINLKGVF